MSLSEVATQMAAAVSGATATEAYTDPAEAYQNRPCLLIAPPTIDWTRGTMAGPRVEWRVVALSSYDSGSGDALDELEELIEAASTVLQVKDATPTQYALTADGRRVAAYLCTLSDYLVLGDT